MNIKEFFPCKKLRRSERLAQNKENEFIPTCTDSYGKPEGNEAVLSEEKKSDLGFFKHLPTEVLHELLRYVSVLDLSSLSVTSYSMLAIIESYRATAAAKKRLFPTCLKPDSKLTPEERTMCVKQFRELGVFMRMSTCLYHTKRRLQIIVPFISNLECTRFSHCRCLYQCLAMSCYGRFLRTIIAGWEEHECCRVFNAIEKTCRITKMVKKVLDAAAGKHRLLEMSVRIFYRYVFLNECSTIEERAFWLTLILKPHPMVHQAKLLFIMYGPLCSADIHWSEMGQVVANDLPAAKHHFKELAMALKTLNNCYKQWTEDDIVGIIEDLTGLPVEWLPENVAGLLYFTGEKIPVLVMGNKCLNGRMAEVATLLTCLAVMSEKFDETVLPVLRLTSRVCNIANTRADKLKLWSCIVDSFHDHLLEQHITFNDLDGSEEEEYDAISPFKQILEAQTAFMQFFLESVNLCCCKHV